MIRLFIESSIFFSLSDFTKYLTAPAIPPTSAPTPAPIAVPTPIPPNKLPIPAPTPPPAKAFLVTAPQREVSPTCFLASLAKVICQLDNTIAFTLAHAEVTPAFT